MKRMKNTISTALLLFVVSLSVVGVLGASTGYKTGTDADDLGHVWSASNLAVNDGDIAGIYWYQTWGSFQVNGFSFGISTKTVTSIVVSIEGKHGGMGWTKFKAKVDYNGDDLGGYSPYSTNFATTWCYRTATIDITDTSCNPDDFTIIVWVNKGLFGDSWFDYLRADVIYNS